ncbi:hypothetical protein QZH41_015821 [Actinostola sp. cb2023]|nr:hypothetical protein QZH41_015821 [Actinostola sp. cb2023]
MKAKKIFSEKKKLHNIDPNSSMPSLPSGESGIHIAAREGHLDCIEFLLEQGADINLAGKLPCLVLLLDAGSKPNAQDMIFDTPLHHVLRARHPPPTAMALMSILLQYGASPSIMGSSDQTPFDIINDTGQSECSDVLMEALGK